MKFPLKLYEEQPAYKIYAFDRGWRIMKYVTENLFKRTDVAARWWFDKASMVNGWGSRGGWFKKYWAYVVIAGMWLAGGIQYVTAMIVAALFLAFQAVALSIWVVLSVMMMALLALFTFAYSRYYRIFCRCPDCHKEMPIPIYLCPTCVEYHTRLWPSIYGVFHHRCSKCGTQMATLGFLGRNKISAICANDQCQRPLKIGPGGTNIHVPIVGGPSTGKTNYIVQATREFKELFETKYRYTIAFTDPNQQRDFDANVRRLAEGRVLVKTPEVVPKAYTLEIRAQHTWVPKLAYIYDAAGEAFITDLNTSQQEYYKYIHGIVFVIDPTAISAFRHIYQADIDLLEDITPGLAPSKLDVMQAYERMIQMLEASINVRKQGRFQQPIAIVMTKVDVLDLENEVGAPAAQRLIAHDPSIEREEDAISVLVRDFLCQYNLENFVRDVEAQFSTVKYFSCSALGRLPSQDDTSSFVPVRVLDPLIWLLISAKAIPNILDTRPLVTRLLEQPMAMVQRRP
jgi:hypothetical protein